MKREYQLDSGKVKFKQLTKTDWKALHALLEDDECTVDRMITVLQQVIGAWTMPSDPFKSSAYRTMNEIVFAQLCQAARAYFAEAVTEFRKSKRLGVQQ